MNKAEEIQKRIEDLIKAGKKGSTVIVGKQVIEFARAEMSDLEWIQNMDTKQLKAELKALQHMLNNNISIRDLQLECLMLLELERRKLLSVENFLKGKLNDK